MYCLTIRHHAPNFLGDLLARGVVTKEWLEIIEDIMMLFTMTNIEKIQYVNLILKGDAKV